MATGDPYVSPDEIAEYLRMDGTAASSGDELLALTATSTTRWVSGYTRRDFNLATAATARYFDTTTAGSVLVDDIGSATITLDSDSGQDGTYGTSWGTSDFQVNPFGALAAGEPITSLVAVGAYSFPQVSRRQGLIRVTAFWGWPAVPEDVKQATLIMAARLYKRHESPTGVLGGAEFGVIRVGTRIDPDVEMLLAPYRYATVGAA